MSFPTLIFESEAPNAVLSLVRDLIEKKAVTRELGSGALPLPIRAFIDSEFAAAHDTFDSVPRAATTEALAQADNFFRATLARFG